MTNRHKIALFADRMKRVTEAYHADIASILEDAKKHDVDTDAHVRIHDTHVKSVTAHDVAEIGAAAQIMNTHVEAAHNKELAKETAKAAEKAERRDI